MIIQDRKNASGIWARSAYINHKYVNTKSGVLWNNMLRRCTSGKQYPTYAGCKMSENFKDFQFFVNWHKEQIGYDLPGYEMDKDILFESNRIYGENTCVKVPHALNSFAVANNISRGLYPQGVSAHKNNRFTATINTDKKLTYLGLFATPALAFMAYKEAKEAEAYKWYKRLVAGEFIVDPRVIERMKNWTLPKEASNGF